MEIDSDDELIELLSCHRPVSWQPLNIAYRNKRMFQPVRWYLHRTNSFSFLSKASLGPYAWQHRPVKRLRANAIVTTNASPQRAGFANLPLERDTHQHDMKKSDEQSAESIWEDSYLRHADLRYLPRSHDVFRKIEKEVCLELVLPKPGSNAGGVLQHAIKTLDGMISKNKPVTFKIGITHDPYVRWHNSVFGYKYSKDPYDFMWILYAASHIHGPSFLEAALIDRYQSFLFAFLLSRLDLSPFPVHSYALRLEPVFIPQPGFCPC